MTSPTDPHPFDQDCLFCKIVAGEIPATIVHESDTTVAFRDLNPQAPTHVLVIPRSHYPNAAALAEGEPATAADLFDAAREIAVQEGLRRRLPDGASTPAPPRTRRCSTPTCTCSADGR